MSIISENTRGTSDGTEKWQIFAPKNVILLIFAEMQKYRLTVKFKSPLFAEQTRRLRDCPLTTVPCLLCFILYSSRLEIPKAEHGSPATQGGCARPKAAAHTGCGITGPSIKTYQNLSCDQSPGSCAAVKSLHDGKIFGIERGLAWTQELNRRLIFLTTKTAASVVAAIKLLCPGQ